MREAYSLFATVGTATQPFDRFVRWVDDAARSLSLPGFIQTGASRLRPEFCAWRDYLPRQQFHDIVERAEVVVVHGGEGSMIEALQAGKRPVVIARLRHLGEHVNDHQLELTRELGKAGLVDPVETPDDLIRALSRRSSAPNRTVELNNEYMLALVAEFIATSR